MAQQVEAKVLVDEAIAQQLPSQPQWAKEVADKALAAMNDLAAERGRSVDGTPWLSDTRDTRLGMVELTFTADTAAR